MSQEEEITDPTRKNIFVCTPESAIDDMLVYKWEVIDVFKGSQVIFSDIQQDGAKLILGENQLRFNREYLFKCNVANASVRGEASHRVKTVEKASDIKLLIEPDTIGVAETTQFKITVEKTTNEDLSCRFYQEFEGKDVRIDDENKIEVFSKENEFVETVLRKNSKTPGSQTIKVMAFCASKSMKAQFIKSSDIFLKPKPQVSDEVTTVSYDSEEQENKIIIDPVGLSIFAGDMNDVQREKLFTDMTKKLHAKSQTESNSLEIAAITK